VLLVGCAWLQGGLADGYSPGNDDVVVVRPAAFEKMQAELEEEGGESGLMSLIQNEYYEGEERHLKFLESYPEVGQTCTTSLSLSRFHPIDF
jgi:hypothetical protein